MFYTIFNCFNRSEVYEEREYRCLGQWREDGLIYTYTERRDMIGYECFVGLVTAKGDLFIREAGNNCERGQEPLKYGMRLAQVSKCFMNPHNNPLWQHQQQQAAGTASMLESVIRPRKLSALPEWKRRELSGRGRRAYGAGVSVRPAALSSLLLVVAVWMRLLRSI